MMIPKHNHTDNENDTRVHELFVCGRICLLGEHSDWASTYKTISASTNPNITDGRALVAGTETGLYCRTSSIKSHTLHLRSTLSNQSQHELQCELSVNQLQVHVNDQSCIFRYACGVAVIILQKYNILAQSGILIDNYSTTLPVKKGLSSSAAYSILICKSFNVACQLNLSDHEIMNIAYLGERLTGSQCGQLDQVCGIVSNTLLVDAIFSNNQLITNQLQLTNSVVYLVIIDLHSSKDTVAILYELNQCYINNINSDISMNVQYMFGVLTQQLVQLGIDIFHGADRTKQLIQHEQQCNINVNKYDTVDINGANQCACQLGRLMTITQSYFDLYAMPACPSQLTAPVLHSILNDSRIHELTYGGKWIGSGGDGSCQLVARSLEDSIQLCDYINNQLHMTTMTITIGQINQ